MDAYEISPASICTVIARLLRCRRKKNMQRAKVERIDEEQLWITFHDSLTVLLDLKCSDDRVTLSRENWRLNSDGRSSVTTVQKLGAFKYDHPQFLDQVFNELRRQGVDVPNERFQ